MGLYPGAVNRLLPPGVNHSSRGISPVGVILHVIEGSLGAADSVFHNPSYQASAHFGVGKDGTVYQWVDTSDKAWAQAAGNPYYISIETEGYHTEGLTYQQIQQCGAIVRWTGCPNQLAEYPVDPGLGWHGMGGDAWGGHYDCPGDIRRGQRQLILNVAYLQAFPEVDLTPDQDQLLRDVYSISKRVEGFVNSPPFPGLGDLVNEIVKQVDAHTDLKLLDLIQQGYLHK